jgi:hypothetical protein
MTIQDWRQEVRINDYSRRFFKLLDALLICFCLWICVTALPVNFDLLVAIPHLLS